MMRQNNMGVTEDKEEIRVITFLEKDGDEPSR